MSALHSFSDTLDLETEVHSSSRKTSHLWQTLFSYICKMFLIFFKFILITLFDRLVKIVYKYKKEMIITYWYIKDNTHKTQKEKCIYFLDWPWFENRRLDWQGMDVELSWQLQKFVSLTPSFQPHHEQQCPPSSKLLLRSILTNEGVEQGLPDMKKINPQAWKEMIQRKASEDQFKKI